MSNTNLTNFKAAIVELYKHATFLGLGVLELDKLIYPKVEQELQKHLTEGPLNTDNSSDVSCVLLTAVNYLCKLEDEGLDFKQAARWVLGEFSATSQECRTFIKDGGAYSWDSYPTIAVVNRVDKQPMLFNPNLRPKRVETKTQPAIAMPSEFDVDEAVVDAIAAEFNEPVANPNLKLMTLGQIRELYPDVRGVVSDAGLVEFDYLLDKYGSNYLFKDYIEGVYGGDYFGRWDHYVDRHNLIGN